MTLEHMPPLLISKIVKDKVIKSHPLAININLFKQIIKTLIKCLTKSKWSWWWKRLFQTTAYRDWNWIDNKIIEDEPELAKSFNLHFVDMVKSTAGKHPMELGALASRISEEKKTKKNWQ